MGVSCAHSVHTHVVSDRDQPETSVLDQLVRTKQLAPAWDQYEAELRPEPARDEKRLREKE